MNYFLLLETFELQFYIVIQSRIRAIHKSLDDDNQLHLEETYAIHNMYFLLLNKVSFVDIFVGLTVLTTRKLCMQSKKKLAVNTL